MGTFGHSFVARLPLNRGQDEMRGQTMATCVHLANMVSHLRTLNCLPLNSCHHSKHAESDWIQLFAWGLFPLLHGAHLGTHVAG